MSLPCPSRRAFMIGSGAAALSSSALGRSAFAQSSRPLTKIRFLLNWKYEGPQGYFFLAEDRGYFRDEGIDIAFDQGSGSAAPAPQVASGAYDMGFGDINALIELVARKSGDMPVAVAVLYNRPPFSIATRADGPIKQPKDLAGKTLGGAANDPGVKLFPAFCKLTGLDPTSVKIATIQPTLAAQMAIRGQFDGVFGYYTTLWFATRLMGADPATQLRFMRYGDYGMDLFANSIIVSHELAMKNPALVSGFLRALFRGLADALANPDAAIAAVVKREALLHPSLERQKFIFTTQHDMNNPSIATLGLGAVDLAKLKRSIDILVEALGLPRTPSVAEVFNPAFLPPLTDRPTKLA
jgi:NitT/TauT family transport system substrate-binding protein